MDHSEAFRKVADDILASEEWKRCAQVPGVHGLLVHTIKTFRERANCTCRLREEMTEEDRRAHEICEKEREEYRKWCLVFRTMLSDKKLRV